jgi:hypothetical protein
MMVSLMLFVLGLLSFVVYYFTRKLHKEDNNIANHEILRIMLTIVYGLYIFILISMLKEYKSKSCKSLLSLFIIIIAAQMILFLLHVFNVMQLDHENKVILNNTLNVSIIIEFIAAFLCSIKITYH